MILNFFISLDILDFPFNSCYDAYLYNKQAVIKNEKKKLTHKTEMNRLNFDCKILPRLPFCRCNLLYRENCTSSRISLSKWTVLYSNDLNKIFIPIFLRSTKKVIVNLLQGWVRFESCPRSFLEFSSCPCSFSAATLLDFHMTWLNYNWWSVELSTKRGVTKFYSKFSTYLILLNYFLLI